VPRRTSPTLLRRQLGTLLRQYREARVKTASEVAEATGINASVISRLETGSRLPGLLYVRELSRHYGLDKETTDRLIRIARASRQSGWWERFDLREESSTYIEFEAGAASIANFELAYVPGLLQTREYATAVIASLNPGLSEEQLDQAVSSRLQRQQILTSDDPAEFHAIIDEGVLHRKLGGPTVMRNQLHHLVQQAASSANVKVQVLPFATESSFGLLGAFAILSFDDEVMADVTYAEGPLGAIVQGSRDDVARCRRIFAGLSTLAASDAESIAIIEQNIRTINV
jgi:transcriptional regulator with XRE-family HTH domain